MEKKYKPLVSIIVVSYNQARYLPDALESAVGQTYPRIEIIIVDDGSTDHTSEVLACWRKKISDVVVIENEFNLGYCKAFNKGWAQAKGDYIIDLSGDDVLMPERVEEGVRSLVQGHAQVHFTDAYYIDANSKILGTHFPRNSTGVLTTKVPQGDIYRELLQRYFICTPTMMMSTKVLKVLNGYDESLHYEDFDFWVRSSRNFRYAFSDRVLVKKRVIANSLSKKHYLPGSQMLGSTARVCLKAYRLNRRPEEHQALVGRLKYELRQSILCNNYRAAKIFYALWRRIGVRTWDNCFYGGLLSLGWNWSFLNPLIRKPL